MELNGKVVPQYRKSYSCTLLPRKITVYFDSMELNELRALIKPDWPDCTRSQALAWLKNRYPCGFMYKFLDPIDEPIYEYGPIPEFNVATTKQA